LYLDFPLYVGRQQVSYFSVLISNIIGEVRGWQSRLMYLGGRAILIRHILLAMPVHLLASTSTKIGSCINGENLNNFFWGSIEGKDKHHWASWDQISEGGVNFRRLRDVYKVSLAMIRWNLKTKRSLWGDFLKSKYFRWPHSLTKQLTSDVAQSWRAICKIRYEV